ncbi:hypothetical protein ACFV0R_03645 [Streptomyces sp. NPDC059578]|uniref:hypothetical protein n=1 Tax=Streptomyces sp. NPDC059578 TaxID=3346874 RepID=UPI0036C24959
MSTAAVTAPPTSRFLIMASGCSTAPKGPEVSGVGEFAGRQLAVIDTGASAVQCVPLIARRAAELTVFPRTPVYALPTPNRPPTGAEVTARKAEYPEFRVAPRCSKSGSVLAVPTRSALEVTAEERDARYEAARYTGANVPGKPRGFLAYPNGAHVYRERCDAVARDGYAGFTVH